MAWRRRRGDVVRWVFLRAMGGVYLVAFTSLGPQVLGLHGKRGILPASELLEELRKRLGRGGYRRVPTLLWLDDSDQALELLCKAGQTASVALMLDIAPRASALSCWGLYLSLSSVGQEFLSFQWDALLLESGLLSVLAAPRGLAPSRRAPPASRAAVALMRWLVFRLYFESGLSKLQSGDLTWRRLTACRHYYETEPLPNRGGWYAHHLPPSLQRASTAGVLGLECLAPLLALGPRRLRKVAFGLLTGLQGAFALTGNYGFFNLLSAALGLWLLDDPRKAKRRRARPLDVLLGAPLFALSGVQLALRFPKGRRLLLKLGPLARGLARLERLLMPFRAVNPYGLFSVMTVRRPEIAIEGSNDGITWREYKFRYKPGSLTEPPRQVAPHQPRLDWQMWFAALSHPPGWFVAFLARLLEGSPEVLGLLKENPFPERPPLYLRAVLYDYRVASMEERKRTGAWWGRERLGLYFPPVSLKPQEIFPEGGFHPHAPALA